jgi:hypothetical protein
MLTPLSRDMMHLLAHLSQSKDMSDNPYCLVFASRLFVVDAEYDFAVRLRRV